MANTRSGEFFISETATAPVDYMNIMKTFNYAVLNDLDATAIEMPYGHSNISFVVILPNEPTGLRSVQQKITSYGSYYWSTITSNMQEKLINVKMPKFKSEFSINLNEALKNVCLCLH